MKAKKINEKPERGLDPNAAGLGELHLDWVSQGEVSHLWSLVLKTGFSSRNDTQSV